MRLVFLVGFTLFLAALNLRAYPSVIDWKNSPVIVFENKKQSLLKKNEELRSPFFAITARLDELKLNLSGKNEIFLFKNSKIQIDEVFEGSEKPVHVTLLNGTIRLSNKKLSKQTVINNLETVFFNLPLAIDFDAIVILDISEPSVTIKMVSGQWDLSFFDYEKRIKLRSGQQVKFRGVSADEVNQIKYDFLLDGKRVPKGHLEEVKKFDVANYKAKEKAAESEILMKDLAAKKKIKDDLKKKKEYEDSFLCKKPFAQINQCAWILENQKCYRQRCNVSGEWGDKTERPLSDQCTGEYLIGKCDY